MLTRRTLLAALATAAATKERALAQASALEPLFDQLEFPAFDSMDSAQSFGFGEPSSEQKAKAKMMIDATPTGPTGLAIAQSFIDRYAKSDPQAISQWPAPAAWNPLIVTFFAATSIKANNDMISWCAAFANWCIGRTGAHGTNSASSQSFISNANFRRVKEPEAGDLVVFTCYDTTRGKSLGLGHVAFVRSPPQDGKLLVIGGNQSGDRHSSIISEKEFPVQPFSARRHVNGRYVPCTMAINGFFRAV